MNSHPALRRLMLIVVTLLPSLGAAQDCGVACALEKERDVMFFIYIEAISGLFGPFYALFQGGLTTLLGALWLLADMIVLRGIFVTVMRYVERESQWRIDGEYVWGYVLLSLLPAVWVALNWAVVSLWALFHPL